MRLPRDLSGGEFVNLLVRHFNYQPIRTRGSQMTLTLVVGDTSHHVTVPRHKELRIGTLDEILGDVAQFVGLTKREVRDRLFGWSPIDGMVAKNWLCQWSDIHARRPAL